ncbi:MAG: LPP20 family lipoprotein [Deltaproteobacteria bacterium]|nr:MAG: LPP20 family lipoprotein [Deltaproteobacteria bacterium]
MTRNWKQISKLVIPIALMIIAGCAAPQPGIQQEKIRANADQAFEDLSAEEDPSRPKASHQRQSRETTPQPSYRTQTEAVKATKGKRPDWIDSESRQYPADLYLTGVGYAPDRQTAEDRSRAEIAKIFHSKIDAKTRTYQEYLQTISGSKTKTSDRIAIEDLTKVSTQKVLSGVRIVEVYQQTKPEPLFYALAALDRRQAQEILQSKIRELDQDIQKLIALSNRQTDKLSKIKNLKTSVGEYILRDAYNTELRIINPAGQGIPPQVSFSAMKKQLSDALLRDFFIVVSVKGSRAGEIRQSLIEALNQEGFSVSDDLSRASVLARGTIEIHPIEQKTSEWKYVRWKAYFDLVDQQGGAVFGSVKKTGKEGHLTFPEAEERAVRKMRKLLAAEIAQDMTKFIFSQGQ